MRKNKAYSTLLLVLVLLSFGTASTIAQEPNHEVRLYTIPSMYPIRWDSPAILYKSAKHCFYKTISLKDNYLLGHMVVCLNTPLLPQKRYLAMTAANKMQRVDLILKERIGLAILGATLEGELEKEEHIKHMLDVYTIRKKLAYISFKVSESTMLRILDFVQQFSRCNSGEPTPSNYYGGFYWPLYENEGAGCSAFALGVLAAASILPAESDAWLKNVNIPISLIGGEYRENDRIPFGRIKRTKSWYDGSGLPNIDFVKVQTYDPNALFDWILKRRLTNDTIFVAAESDGAPGLTVDDTFKLLPSEKPYFKKRMESNLFLDVYRKKLKQEASQPTP